MPSLDQQEIQQLLADINFNGGEELDTPRRVSVIKVSLKISYIQFLIFFAGGEPKIGVLYSFYIIQQLTFLLVKSLTCRFRNFYQLYIELNETSFFATTKL